MMTSSPIRAGRPRSIQLDVLRGIAILLVLGRHSLAVSATAGPLRPLAGAWNRFGWTGVDLFFVLSGFLIGGLLFEELRDRGRLDLRRFLIRRAFKIWPLYYFFTVVSMVLVFWRVGRSSPSDGLIQLREFVPIALNVQNYFIPSVPRWHLWSLAVEEHFYLALPLALAWMSGRKGGRSPGKADPMGAVPLLVLIVVVACTILRCLTVASLPYDPRTHLFPTHLRIDSLAFGVLLAYLRAFRPAIWALSGRYRGRLMAAGIALIAPMALLTIEHSPLVSSLGYNALYLGYGAILVACLAATPGSGLAALLLHGRLARSIAFVGLYSYPIYLWHIELGRGPATWLFYAGDDNPAPDPVRWSAAMAAYVALSIVAGVSMGRLVERPALAIRERLFPGRTATVEDAPAVAEPVNHMPPLAVPTIRPGPRARPDVEGRRADPRPLGGQVPPGRLARAARRRGGPAASHPSAP